MADSIVQLNKTKLILRGSPTTAGTASAVFASEADAVRISVHVAQVTTNLWWEITEVGGAFTDNELRIYTSKTFSSKQDPVSITIPAGQKLRLTVHHGSGETQYQVQATGVGGAMASLQYQIDKDLGSSGPADDKEFRIQVLSNLEVITDSLMKITNQLRLITGANVEDAEEF